MADFEPDDESIDRASTLSSWLIGDIRSAVENSGYEEGTPRNSSVTQYSEVFGTPIDDVLFEAGRIAGEFALARRYLDDMIPCLRLNDETVAPISVSELAIAGRPIFSPPWFGRRFRLTDLLTVFPNKSVEAMHVSSAEKHVESGLRSFLSYRFAGFKNWARWGEDSQRPEDFGRHFGRFSSSGSSAPPSSVGAGSGLHINVSCKNAGLRIHVSPAYFINWVFFGSPSTPVASYMLPGRYVFAADGAPLSRRTQDPAVFAIPPTLKVSLTRF